MTVSGSLAPEVRPALRPFPPFASPRRACCRSRRRSRALLHQLHLGAIRADDIVTVGDKATSDQRSFAARADEAIVMPVPVLERDEASTANT